MRWGERGHGRLIRAMGRRARSSGGIDGARRTRLRPEVLALEDRRLLSTFTVTSTDDTLDGANNPTAGTLRWAIQQANAATDPSTIAFDATAFATPQTISLLQGEFVLSNTKASITITAPTAGVTIQGSTVYPYFFSVFHINVGVSVTMDGLTVAHGSSESEGGIYNAGTLFLSSCILTGNSDTAGGGALKNEGAATLDGCTISGNGVRYGDGAGILNDMDCTITLRGCTVSDNYDNSNAGGLCNLGTAYLIGCTFATNGSSISGGAIKNEGVLSLEDCTLTSNGAWQGGGGLYNDGTATLLNTIIAGNDGNAEYQDPGGGDINGTGTISGSYNLVGPVSGGLVNGQDGNIVVANPLLSWIGNYGGPLQTVALLPGSPAIGAGTIVGGITVDERGVTRDPSHPDIGAFQSRGFTITAVAGSSPQSASVGSAFANPLAVTVTANDPNVWAAYGVVTFAAPASGASAQLSATTVTIDVNSVASVKATANSVGGSYAVNVSAAGIATPATFALTNLVSPGFSGLSDASIIYGTSSLTVVGTLAYGSLAPQGDTITVTLDGKSQAATVGAGGAFSTTFSTSTLGVTGSPYTIQYSFGGDTTFAAASATSKLTVTRATPNLTWASLADIAYGTALGGSQLDATSPVPGTFIYTPAAGTVLGVGAGQTLSVTFTPTDTADYATATASVTINVVKATPVIAWAKPADITYGAPLGGSQLDATASVPGSFVYSPALGTVLKAGAGQTLSVTFTPTDTTDYTAATATTTINVLKAMPAVTWPNPADIIYGTALGASQLDATASVPGTFVYAPAAGTVLRAGTGQSLSVTFTPTDTLDYSAVTTTAMINVRKLTPIVTWPSPTDLTFGSALGGSQLDATASVPGSFTYTPAAGTVLKAGAGQTLSVTFTPTDTTDYTAATATTTINILKATPTVTWPSPADITYGAKLAGAQLDATASVPGTFVYTPANGTLLKAGAGQTLSVTFSPTDAVDYATTVATTTINVLKAATSVTWAAPADISYGTALGAGQLNATASVPGTLTYTPAPGTALKAGAGQTLSVAFTPTDAADYLPSSASVTINVRKSTPEITWPNPADIAYGTALGAAQLDATASVPGTFAYTPASGTVLKAGVGQTLSVTFSPADPADYDTVTATASINVARLAPAVTWPTPVAITYGTALGAAQLDATASVPGTFAYMQAAGTVLKAGAGQALTVIFTPTDAVDYAPATATTTLDVAKASPSLGVSAAGGSYDSGAFAGSYTLGGVNGAPAVDLEGVRPTLTYFAGPTTSGADLGSSPPTHAGTYTVMASFAGTADYAAVRSAPATFTIDRAAATVSLTSSLSPTVYGQPLTLVATVGAVGSPGGQVTFYDGNTPLGTSPVDGSGKATLTTTALATGSHAITARFDGGTDFTAVQSSPTPTTVRADATGIAVAFRGTYKKKNLNAVGLTATVNPAAPGGGVPTGQVTFEFVTKKRKKTTVKILGTATLGAGQATLTVKPQKVMNKVLTVVYGSDANFLASTVTLPKLTKKAVH